MFLRRSANQLPSRVLTLGLLVLEILAAGQVVLKSREAVSEGRWYPCANKGDVLECAYRLVDDKTSYRNAAKHVHA